MALWNTYRARKVERENPPAGRFVTVDGIRLHYIEKGAGSPPVILIHGNVVTAEDFDLSGLLDLVAERHRVVAFDRPGFGYSDRPHGAAGTPAAQADLLRRAFERLGIERPVVLGHSWGALVALALALNHPHAVRGLVLLSGYYYPNLRADVPLLSLAAIPLIGDVLRYTISPLIGAAMLPLNFKLMFAPAPVPDRFAKGFPRGVPLRPSQLRAETQESATMVAAVSAMRDRYDELRMPVVIMAGAKDRVVDVGRHAVRLHKDILQSSLRVSPDVGHMLHHAVPEQVADAIRAAMADHPMTAAPRRAAPPAAP